MNLASVHFLIPTAIAVVATIAAILVASGRDTKRDPEVTVIETDDYKAYIFKR